LHGIPIPLPKGIHAPPGWPGFGDGDGPDEGFGPGPGPGPGPGDGTT